MEQKELPQEIVDKIKEQYRFVLGGNNVVGGARIASEHYEPQITALKEELERVKGLLRENFGRVRLLEVHCQGYTPNGSIIEEQWQAYCKEHNL